MSNKNNKPNKENNQYNHLTFTDRCKIQALIEIVDKNNKPLYSISEIARQLGKHKSTISRELKRTTSKINPRTGKIKNLPYDATRAHDNYLFKRGLSKGEYIINKNKAMKKFIEDKILIDKWAPDVIAGYMEKNKMYLLDGFDYISTPTIYRCIHLGILNVKKKDTRRMEKFHKEESKYKIKKPIKESKKAYSIEIRPDTINNRSRFGDFELDTVLSSSKGSHQCLMTLTERLTRFEMIFRLEAKTKQEVVDKFNLIKNKFKKNFSKFIKSLSTDNGSEFDGFLQIIKDTDTKIYFCHPYASGEKGTNEKHNGMIRYFIPKGNLIEDYSNNDLNNITSWMNNYPRKILNYKTPIETLKEHLSDNEIIKLINLQLSIQK